MLYWQKRISISGLPFDILKILSVKIAADAAAEQFSLPKDNRIARVGKFIRKVRIDELPKLFDVLRDDMSFVGPRSENLPLSLNFLAKYLTTMSAMWLNPASPVGRKLSMPIPTVISWRPP